MTADQITRHWYTPEVQRAILWSVVLGGLSSTASAVMAHHISPSDDLKKDIIKGTVIGAATTVASLAFTLYKLERAKAKA
jgi:hypothetical protein